MHLAVTLLAIAEALATASFTTTPRDLSQNSRLLGPKRLFIERAGNTGGGTIYSASLLGPNSANRQDLVGDGVATNYDTNLTYVAFSNYNWVVKVSKAAKAGTVAVTAGSKTITGTSTNFDPELQVGDKVMVADQVRTIVSIASDTSATVDRAFVTAASGVSLFVLDGILRETIDYTVANNGGKTRITLTNAYRAQNGAKVEVHYLVPVTLFTFATATLVNKQFEIADATHDLLWYASDATASPSSTNIYVEPIGH